MRHPRQFNAAVLPITTPYMIHDLALTVGKVSLVFFTRWGMDQQTLRSVSPIAKMIP